MLLLPFGALVRAIRYSSEYSAFKREEAHICMSLLLNKYPMSFILRQLERVPQTFQCAIPTRKNYSDIRKTFLIAAGEGAKKARIDFEANILCHFTFCKGMNHFSTRFHTLWDECFADTAMGSIKPIVGSRRLENLQEYLVRKKPDRSRLKLHGKSTLAIELNSAIKESSDKRLPNNPMSVEESAIFDTNGAPACSGIVHFHPTRAAFSAI